MLAIVKESDPKNYYFDQCSHFLKKECLMKLLECVGNTMNRKGKKS
jgi:hypothetical protein